MILSNEPGFYLPGHYGIRLENLLLVQDADLPAAGKPFLRFETLTLAPFDRHLLNPALMSPAEIAWLNAYHARVLKEVGPELGETERAWLHHACRSITELSAPFRQPGALPRPETGRKIQRQRPWIRCEIGVPVGILSS